MTHFQRETTRMIMQGQSKKLILQSCGPTCGMFDGYLCEDCYGYGKLVIEDEEEKDETSPD